VQNDSPAVHGGDGGDSDSAEFPETRHGGEEREGEECANEVQ